MGDMTYNSRWFFGFLSVVFLLALVFSPALSLTQTAAQAPAASPAGPGQIRDFNLISGGQGWLLTDQELFSTSDNGSSWTGITPPDSGVLWAVDFFDPASGWAITSPLTRGDPTRSGFSLAATGDGGRSWQSHPLDLDPFPDLPGQPPEAVTLIFNDPLHGQLFFKRPTSSNFNLYSSYATSDGGATWQKLAAETLPPEPPNLLAAPGLRLPETSGQVIKLRFPASSNSAAEPGTLNLQPSTILAWALVEQGSCVAKTACTQVQTLFSTTDGGQTWQPLALPAASAPEEPGAPQLQVSGQGFDKCEIPTREQLQEWWNQGPYTAVNIYIGGIMRSCANNALNPTFLSDLDRQGWTLIPTWVGPQASCSGFKYVMSADPATAYQQGIAEANAAASVAGGLKLWGQALYYDLEGFPSSNAGCLEAAKAFMNGWTFRLHEWGYPSGVYGSPCSSGLASFWSLPNPPEAAWIALWLTPAAYNPDATVWTNVCGFSDSYWPNHQRLRQYAGGHPETWGSVTLTIDSNALDGYVAQAYGQPTQICPRPASPAKAGVILYTAANYDCYGRGAGFGYVWRDRSGFQNLSSFFDERASSIYIPTGWSALLYENRDRGGGKICINAPGDANFAGKSFDNGHALDSLVSSFEVFAGKNCTEPAPVTPSADSTPPIVHITSPVTGGSINPAAGPVLIQADLSDPGSGISHAQFFGGGDTGSGWAWQPVGYDHDGSNGWSASWSPSNLASLTDIGVYVVAWDQAGNPAGASVLHLNAADGQPPVSAIDPLPASLDSTAVQLILQATDNLSGIASYDVQVQVDGGAWSDWQLKIPGGSPVYATYFAQLGQTVGFRARAVDKAGNQEAYPAGAETSTKINLCAADAFEANNTLAAAKTLNINTPQTHNICGVGDQDWLSFKVSAGKAYLFSTGSLGPQTNTVLGLYAADGSLIAQNDDFAGGLYSRLYYFAPADGTVYIKITHKDGRIAGAAITYSASAVPTSLQWLPVIGKP